MFGNIGPTEILIIIFIFIFAAIFLGILPYWMIYKKTGQSGAMSLLQLIPVVNIIMIFVLAFGEWPIERELTQLRRMRQDDKPQP
jgi:hypothetical protein